MKETGYLYHYYEKKLSPFRTITSLTFDEAKTILLSYQAENPNLTHPNIEWFLSKRYEMEKVVRNKFIEIGGKPIRVAPVYFTLGENEGMKTWYTNTSFIKIPIEEFDLHTVSFT